MLMKMRARPRLCRGSGYRSFGLRRVDVPAIVDEVGLRMTSLGGVCMETSLADIG